MTTEATIHPGFVTPFITEIVEALGADNVRFVGGCVRDSIRKDKIKDVDLASLHEPEKAMELLDKACITVSPTGLKHGTITAIHDYSTETVEITTLRKDVECDGRHALVEYTDDWLEDAKRRDFTMNSIYLHPTTGEVFDPFGGINDALNGIIKFVGDPERRIKEDALRILRLYRFLSTMGAGTVMCSGAFVAAVTHKELLEGISKERITSELLKIFGSQNPLRAVKRMAYSRTFGTLRLNISVEALDHLLDNEIIYNHRLSSLERILLSGELKNHAQGVKNALCLSSKQEKIIDNVQKVRLMCSAVYNTPSQARKLAYDYGKEAVLATSLADDWLSSSIKGLHDWEIPDMPVRGQDIISMGRTPGEHIGKILAQLEAIWIRSDFTMTREQLLEWV